VTTEGQLRDQVRDRYAQAAAAVTAGEPASCCEDRSSCCSPEPGPGAHREGSRIDQVQQAVAFELDGSFGAAGYSADERDELPAKAVLASLGCGNPPAVADLRPGERVLDLGSGGGIDVLLSARRVGPSGRVFGLDMTDEMLALARANAARVQADNVEFLKGHIEAIPLPAGSVDVVISNCVLNLSTDKPAVLAEMFRVLRPGGRIGISDVVSQDQLSPDERAERGSYVGCIAGALSRMEYLDGLAAAGFVGASVEFGHEAVPGMHAAIVRAVKP